jgi:thiol-disulfide isomerase/thioredoxin
MIKFAAFTFALALSLAHTVAHSAEVPFNQQQFDAARAAGQPVAVAFHADWCPTCRAQAPVLKELSQSPDFKSVTIYIANFDSEKSLKASLGVTKQSTIVVFKDGKERARSTGDTQREPLAELLHIAIS